MSTHTDSTQHGNEHAPALSVWATAQTAPVTQRRGRYHRDSTAHPAKMLPEVAAHAIRHYTEPGELVLDPMCGIGTTLVEATHAGRYALGVEYEPHWAQTARTNLTRTAGHVITGDARHLPALLPDEYRNQAALVVTSPPYGNTLDRGNLANLGHHRLLSGFTKILAATANYHRQCDAS